ncbi:hypothetical protein JZ751_020012 [Albula glossodonta]|uniref:Cilia and flagella associated protein 410 n=1 Tax=Albula glossodonta TaxID=121402 RepID=A0A8T2NNM6_9TELE|nr:hypothetical protein JZ751_020012 [Albula glossodonta]
MLSSETDFLCTGANQICSLEHISQCQNLTELYLRRNHIESLGELCHLRHLAQLRVLWLAENPCCVVTEEELARALEEGEEIKNPPAPVPISANGLTEADSENDPLNYSMEETNKIREQLGMKPLPRDKFSSPRDTAPTLGKKSHVLEAVLLLLKELNFEELQLVQKTAEHRQRTLHRHNNQAERSEVIQQ